MHGLHVICCLWLSLVLARAKLALSKFVLPNPSEHAFILSLLQRPLTFNGFEMKAADDSMAISGGGDNGTVSPDRQGKEPRRVGA